MKLSTRGRYGVRALVYIALTEEDGPVAIHTIAERQGISERYLEQLLKASVEPGEDIFWVGSLKKSPWVI